MNKKRCLIFISLLLMTLTLLTPAALADGSAPVIIPDSENEVLFAPIPAQTQDDNQLTSQLQRLTLTNSAADLSCSFINDSTKRAYVKRMIQWYLSYGDGLQATLDRDLPVLMLFEGGSDNDPSTATYRDGALMLVIRQNSSGQPYVAFYCKNCSTLPDYPFYYAYANGHEGYGSATAMDGIYSVYTANHKNIYAGFNVREGDGTYSAVPCAYMKSGGFSLLNGVGINVHTRTINHVTGMESHPNSAGCLLIGDSAPFYEYNDFINNAAPAFATLTTASYSGYTINKYASGSNQFAGKLVLDRYLAKSEMNSIYGAEATEFITAFSTRCQASSTDYFASCTYYPSYQSASLSGSTALRELPNSSAASLGNVSGQVTVTGLYKNPSGQYWYNVFAGNKAGFVPASNISSATRKYDDVCIHSQNWPTRKEAGKSFGVTGIIGTAYNRLASVTGSIRTSSGQSESTYTATGPFRTYSLNAADDARAYSQSLDYNLAFGGLPLGDHNYKITAQVRNYYVSGSSLKYEDKDVVLVNKDFRVGSDNLVCVTLDTQGGSLTTGSVYAEQGGTLSSLPEPTYAGHTFEGWYTAANGGDQVTADTVFNADTTIYAHWTESGTSTPTPDPNPNPNPNPDPNPQPHVPSGDLPFADVYVDDWFHDDVAYAWSNGLMSGTGEDTFSPYQPTSRGMIVSILYRLAGYPAFRNANTYDDVAAGSYYEMAIVWASGCGIVSGYGNGSFGPNDSITREQMAAILYRYAAYKSSNYGSSAALDFTDEDLISSFARQPLAWCVGQHLISGMGDGTLNPQGHATRAQTAAILHRFAER